MKILQLAAQLILCSLLPSAAFAVDGVLEINQACAINGGCFKDDTAGFPVTLSEPGSYRLTSNLLTGTRAVTAILITTSDVTVDLNGFTIACFFGVFIPVQCTAVTPGTGHGVAVDDLSRFRVTVRNGVVRGMGDHGIRVGHQGRVEKVHAAGNGDGGIFAGISSTVTGNTVYNNGGSGIGGASACTVTGNTSKGNGDREIFAGPSSTVTGNTALGNGGTGISASAGSLVIGNAVRFSTGFGIDLSSSSSGYRENVISENTAGTVSAGTNLGNNLCDSGACP